MILLMMCAMAYAKYSVEFVEGGLTYHMSSANPEYSPKLTKDGALIYSQLQGIKLTQNKYCVTLFTGRNSVDRPIQGMLLSYEWQYKHYYVGPVAGAYIQDNQYFYDQDIEPLTSNGFIPILGAVVSYRVDLNKNWFFKLNNIISPVILNSTVSIGREL